MMFSMRLFKFMVLLTLVPTATVFSHAGQPTLVYLIRHAEKQVDGTNDPALSTAGEARVRMLQSFFEAVPLDDILATPFQRTQLTVEPLAQARDMKVRVLPAMDMRQWRQQIKRNRGKSLLIAGHSNTIPAIIKSFGVEAPSIDESEYDYVFLLVVHGRHSRLQIYQLETS